MGKRDTNIEDDAELWARVAQTALPLKKKNRVARIAAPPKPARPPKASAGKASAAGKATIKAPVLPPRPSHAPHAGLDRQTARKLGKGSLAVEARLDLHGMRQRDAHVALRKFLKWAQAKDYRHVLVITGKGSPRATPSTFYEDETRGVLRQAVPHWLSHGDLAPLIVSFSEAPRRLGGEGALYVRLRKFRPK
ncbi:MAG: Smr/MutS family protein [Methyloceanibacter sp.]|uniref:Smr/MutS family protein n=1 Tax=Methyloceanibacter sp. TaxID=1965321 RepID=UPI003EE3AAFD